MKHRHAMRIAALSVIVALVLVGLSATVPAQDRDVQIQRPGPTQINPEDLRIQRPRIQLDPQILQQLGRGPEIVFEAKLDPEILERTASLEVFRLQRPYVNENTMRNLADRYFGGEMRQMQSDRFLAMFDERGSNFLAFAPRTGLLTMERGMADQIDDRPGELPGEERAVDIARSFLREARLMPPQDQSKMVLAEVGRIRSASFDPASGQEGQPLTQMLTVYFARQLGDIRVIGPGSKAVVQIGDGGEVVGAGLRWRALGKAQKIGRDALRSPDQVMADVRQFITREMRGASRVVVDHMGLYYWDNGGEYLQPVVGYQCVVQLPDMKLNYFGRSPLLNNPPEMVVPQPVGKDAIEMLQQSPREIRAPREEGD